MQYSLYKMDKKRDFSFSSYFYFHPETYVPLISCHLKCCSCSNGFNGNYLRVSFSLAIDTEMHKKRAKQKKNYRRICVQWFFCTIFFHLPEIVIIKAHCSGGRCVTYWQFASNCYNQLNIEGNAFTSAYATFCWHTYRNPTETDSPSCSILYE